ncbi:hypothetical protein B5181_34045, partial [Streptomyces sp. 4F]
DAVAGGLALTEAWDRAATAATEAAAATAGLLPRKGRARPHAEKSLGTPDAGAHSLALITRAVHGVLIERPHDDRPHDDRPHDDRPHEDHLHDHH